MTEYQGHRSWNAWNVSLWIANDEGTYRLAAECCKDARNLNHATTLFCSRSGLLGTKTPDGAIYNHRSIRDAIDGLDLTYGRA